MRSHRTRRRLLMLLALRLQADPLDEAVEWMLTRKATWQARMDRLETHLHRTGEQHE
jgi:hypothetical protein